MAAPKFKLDNNGVRELLLSGEVRRDLYRRGQAMLSAARASAPYRTGAYRNSLRVEQSTRSDRASVRVVADVDYALKVEADSGNLARALDAAG
jgi:hypothetical protein